MKAFVYNIILGVLKIVKSNRTILMPSVRLVRFSKREVLDVNSYSRNCLVSHDNNPVLTLEEANLSNGPSNLAWAAKLIKRHPLGESQPYLYLSRAQDSGCQAGSSSSWWSRWCSRSDPLRWIRQIILSMSSLGCFDSDQISRMTSKNKSIRWHDKTNPAGEPDEQNQLGKSNKLIHFIKPRTFLSMIPFSFTSRQENIFWPSIPVPW